MIPSVTTVNLTEDHDYKNRIISTSNCDTIRYILPDTQTQNHFQTLPDFVTLTVVDLSDLESNPDTSILFGDVSEIYMDTENLYITSRLYAQHGYRCGFAGCILPVLQGDVHTLVHKMSI